MTERELPYPGTPTEIYLAAVYDRLGELLDRIPAPPKVRMLGPGEVELREPAVPAPVDGGGGASPTASGDAPGPDADTSRRPAHTTAATPTPGKGAPAKTAPTKPSGKRPARRAASTSNRKGT